MRMYDRPEWGQWVTPRLLRGRPIYRWYVYPHSYDQALVAALVTHLEIDESDVVWDPFVGAGTTLLACRDLGLGAIGTDMLPISVLASQAKIQQYNPIRLRRALEEFEYRALPQTIDRFAPVPVVRKALSSYRRRQISDLANQIDSLDYRSRLFFRLALLRTIDDLSLGVKNGGWLRIDRERESTGRHLKSVFEGHVASMLADVEAQDRNRHYGRVSVKTGDARSVEVEPGVSACITSPPYLNRHDYTRVFALELALFAVSSKEQLIALRRSLLRSHVEARAPRSARNAIIQLPLLLQGLIRDVEDAGANDRRVLPMIRGYFEDMYLVMRNISRQLVHGGKLAFVVGNTRHAGVMIPVDEILALMAGSCGLEAAEIIVTRRRGNSAQQMATYGREPSRESVVILRKQAR